MGRQSDTGIATVRVVTKQTNTDEWRCLLNRLTVTCLSTQVVSRLSFVHLVRFAQTLFETGNKLKTIPTVKGVDGGYEG